MLSRIEARTDEAPGSVGRSAIVADGQRLVVTVRAQGMPRKQLIDIDLQTGARTTLLDPGAAETIGWPTIGDDGTVYVESSVADAHEILAVMRAGARFVAVTSPASEPAASGAYLAYKVAERTARGRVAVVSTAGQGRYEFAN